MTQRRMARPSLGGMLATRQGALLLAVVCAVCAAGIIVFALGQYRTGLKTPVVQTTVLVATGNIAKGTSGDLLASRQLYKATPIQAPQMSPGAITDASELTGKVASVDIVPGQQLTVQDFAGVTGVTGLLLPDQRAIALSIGESPGATDILQPGDRVDIYVGEPHGVLLAAQGIEVIKQSGGTVSTSTGTPSAPAATPTGTTPAASSSTSGTSTTAGAAATSAPGATTTGASMVLAVNEKQAADITYLAQSGASLYLLLRPANASGSAPMVANAATVARDAVAYANLNTKGAQ